MNYLFFKRLQFYIPFILIILAIVAVVAYISRDFVRNQFSKSTQNTDYRVTVQDKYDYSGGEILNLKNFPCNEQLNGFVLHFQQDDKNKIFITSKNDPKKQTLKDQKIQVFDNSCTEIKNLNNNFVINSTSANAINGIDMVTTTFVIDYHINSQTSLTRRFEIGNNVEKYFFINSENYNSESYSRYSISYAKANWNKSLKTFTSDEIPVEFQYPDYFDIDTYKPDNIAGYIKSKSGVAVLEETCVEKCLYLASQQAFTIEEFENLKDMPGYKNEKNFDEWAMNTVNAENLQGGHMEGEYIKHFELKDKSASGYYSRIMKRNGSIRLFTEVYLQKNGKYYVINSNIPSMTSLDYDKDFEEILNTLHIN